MASFYEQVPVFEDFAHVADWSRYSPVPNDWWVALTDVRGSTQAIQQGRYRAVNAMGVGSILSVLNAVGERSLPFVFGGDGATVLVPPSSLSVVREALAGIRRIAREEHDLELRIALIPIAHLRRAGHEVLVARYQLAPGVVLAMFRGGGLAHADALMKQSSTYWIDADQPGVASLSGFECRWNPIASREGVVLTMLATALPPDEVAREGVYRTLVSGLDEILAEQSPAAPAHSSTLSLATDPEHFRLEARSKGGAGWLGTLRWWFIRLQTTVARFLLRFRLDVGVFNGRDFVRQVVAHTDFRKFDDTLRMVLDVSEDQAAAIEALLEQLGSEGQIAWGTHRSSTALMTCMVKHRRHDHLHFVDGGDGGYALAALQLKSRSVPSAADPSSAPDPAP